MRKRVSPIIRVARTIAGCVRLQVAHVRDSDVNDHATIRWTESARDDLSFVFFWSLPQALGAVNLIL